MDDATRKTLAELYGAKQIYGPYVNTDGRRRCVIYIAKQKKSSKLYSRLLVEARLGRILSADEHVDHIDEDPFNDDPSNLQVLTKEAHRAKSGAENAKRQSKRVRLVCPGCGNSFECPRWRMERTGKPCCSRSCSGKVNWRNQYAGAKE